MPFTCAGCNTVHNVAPLTCGDCTKGFCGGCTAACADCVATVCIHCYTSCDAPGCGAILCGSCSDQCEKCADVFCDAHAIECDDCGEVFCVPHSRPCAECGGSFCEKDSIQCDHCQDTFCLEDSTGCVSCNRDFCDTCGEELLDCLICAEDGCAYCLQTCHVCEQRHCKNCVRTCSSCGKEACRGHALKVYGKAGTHCQNCVDTYLGTTQTIVACEKDLPANTEKDWLKLFDPPIVFFRYSQRKKTARPDNVHDWQAEHPIPNSAFLQVTGRTGQTVPHAGSYSEGQALTFWICDDQTPGQEHKFITDYEREFAIHCFNIKQFPTVEQWFQVMENGWKEMLLQFRDYKGPTGATPQDTENMKQAAATRAAAAMRAELQKHYFKKLKIDQKKCRTKIGLKSFKVPKATVKTKSQFDAF